MFIPCNWYYIHPNFGDIYWPGFSKTFIFYKQTLIIHNRTYFLRQEEKPLYGEFDWDFVPIDVNFWDFPLCDWNSIMWVLNWQEDGRKLHIMPFITQTRHEIFEYWENEDVLFWDFKREGFLIWGRVSFEKNNVSF